MKLVRGRTYDELVADFVYVIPDRFNLGQACADNHPPDSPAVVSVSAGGTSSVTTYRSLSDATQRLAGALDRAGVQRGDRVAVVAPQSLEVAIAHLAIWKLGAVSLPLASLFGSDALQYRLTDSGAKLAIVSDINVPKVSEAAAELPILELGTDFDDAIRDRPLASVADTGPEDPVFLIYTSGTTGPPKGALHAHRTIFGHLPGFELFYDFAPHPHDVIWTPADWAWIGALMDVVIPALFYGMTVLTADIDFEPHSAIDLMVTHRVTLAFLPPTALKMMRAADIDGSGLALRAIFTGGEALGEEMLSWAESTLGCPVNEGYGQTEANIVVGNSSRVWAVRPGSMGKAIPGHVVEVQDDNGLRLIGQIGEVVVKAPDPVMMLRYWNQPEATASKYRNGWLLTGDLGTEDEDGYLWFESRKDDVISSMGYRIGPGEIEESLMRHPAVALCAVVGAPDEIRGEVPVAFVVLRPGFEASDSLTTELQNHVRRRLAGHEVPRRISYLDQLPRTATGKVMRRSLRD